MRQTINLFRATLAVAPLLIAACDGSGNSAASPGSSDAAVASIKALAAATASLSGTTIPSATKITDSSAIVWTLSSGLVDKNGVGDGISSRVTLLLYDNKVLYQENSSHNWYSWNGRTWASASADPRLTASLSGTSIPAETQITNGSATVWVVSGGLVYKNGVGDGISNGVTLLLYDNGTIYQQNSAGNWWSWSAGKWASSSDPRKTTSANGTSIPATPQITDSRGNIWTVSGGAVYEDGLLAASSANVTGLVYDGGVIYQENSADKWWTWSGSAWVSSTAPVATGTTPTISGSPATADTVGMAYSFVPTTTNPGGGTMSFSVTNLPAWTVFSTVTGALTGTPSSGQTGAYADIIIGVSSGGSTAAYLAGFSINVTAGSTTGSASLSWAAPIENTNGTALTDLEGYTIYYGTSAGDLTQSIQLASTATSYVVSNLNSGTYYFTVAANASDGTESAQSPVGSLAIP